MWTWVAHRLAGVMLFFFLFAHVIDTALVNVSPEAYDTAMETYKTPIVGLMEVGLVAAVLFHAFNGLRIVLVDFWSQGPRYQRQMSVAVLIICVALFVPFLVRHLGIVF
jgi:succinate dehydrogenase / fumarate reductase cytochrome b subunit